MQGLIALGKSLIEPPLQLGVGTPKVYYFVIESCGHMLTRQPPPLPEHTSTGTRRRSGRAWDSITFSPKTSSRFRVFGSSARLKNLWAVAPEALATFDRRSALRLAY